MGQLFHSKSISMLALLGPGLATLRFEAEAVDDESENEAPISFVFARYMKDDSASQATLPYSPSDLLPTQLDPDIDFLPTQVDALLDDAFPPTQVDAVLDDAFLPTQVDSVMDDVHVEAIGCAIPPTLPFTAQHHENCKCTSCHLVRYPFYPKWSQTICGVNIHLISRCHSYQSC
jgi:hypothetical protein